VHDLKHALGDACENSAAPLVLLTTSRSEYAVCQRRSRYRPFVPKM